MSDDALTPLRALGYLAYPFVVGRNGRTDKFSYAFKSKGPDGVVSVLEHRARQGLRIRDWVSEMQHELTVSAPQQASDGGPLVVRSIATALRVEPTTIYREIRSGRLPSYRVGSGRGTIRVSRAAFMQYLDDRGIPASELAVAL